MEQAARRGIPEEIVLDVAANPEQTVRVSSDREIRQSHVADRGRDEDMLIRVVVDRLGDEDLIVTAYRTSKIQKYWTES